MSHKNDVVDQIIEKVGLNGLDFMGFPYSERTSLTFHHIKKRCNEGTISVDNGAILTRDAHRFLHYLEKKDIQSYIKINLLFKALILSNEKITSNYWIEIGDVVGKAIEKHWQAFVEFIERNKKKKEDLLQHKKAKKHFNIYSLNEEESCDIKRQRKMVKAKLKDYLRR